MTTAVDTACPVCGIEPVEGLISHKHDCPLHQRRVKAKLDKEHKRLDRERRKSQRLSNFHYWKSRAVDILFITFVGAALLFAFLVLSGVISE